MANIEEARYDVLISADGKELVQARYAVRNNQRNFVKITLPAGATVWSACSGGQAGAPGPGAGRKPVCCRSKNHAAARTHQLSPWRLLYLAKATAWQEKGQETSDAASAGSSDFAHRHAAVLPANDSKSVRSRALSARSNIKARVPQPCSPRSRQADLGGGACQRSVGDSPKEFDRLDQFAQAKERPMTRKRKTHTRALLDTSGPNRLAER